METCISFESREKIPGLVSKHPSLSALANSKSSVMNKNKTDQFQLPPLLQSKPKASGTVLTLKPPPPKGISKLKPKSEEDPFRPEQNEDESSRTKTTKSKTNIVRCRIHIAR